MKNPRPSAQFSLQRLFTAPPGTDVILPVTRALAVFILPFLIAAAALLYLWPAATEQTFAWTIQSSMTAMMLGAAYLGGMVFFTQAARARRWHAIKVGFWPVICFAGLLGVATLLHWDRFNHSHISFITWAVLYFTTPFLVALIWFLNRSQDLPPAQYQGPLLPRPLRLVLAGVGLVTLLISLVLFVSPQLMIGLWPWALTPLTARVMGAMFALPGLVGLGIAADPRWSSARIILQSQAFSILMILLAAARAWGEFNPANPAAWLFCGGLAGLFALILWLYIAMELRARRPNS